MATMTDVSPAGAAPSGAADETEPMSEDMRRRNLLRRFWRTAAQFWASEARAIAWTLTGGLLLIIVLLLGAVYAMNVWNRAIFDGLQTHNVSGVAWLSVIYFVILAVSVTLSATQAYVRMTLQRRWRAWLNNKLIDRWL